MTYNVVQFENKTSAKGTQYQKASLIDMNGQTFDNVTVFGMIIKNEGQSIDGFLNSEIYNGQTQYKFKVNDSVKPTGKTAQMEKVMERKETSIANFQDNKEKSIQTAGAITNATNLLVAIMRASDHSWTDEQSKTKLRELITFYKRMYEHPELIAPKTDSPIDYDGMQAMENIEGMSF